MTARTKLIISVIATCFVLAAGSAEAQERLTSAVLQLTVVSLDASQWVLDEEKADPDGDRFFYADHQDGGVELSIHVSELKSGKSDRPLADTARDFMRGVQRQSKHFVERPCPAAFPPSPGWHCAAYESTILRPVPETLTVMYVTAKSGHTIYKKAKYPLQSTPKQVALLASALGSVTLRP
jgi:hypothetical protein